MIMKLMRKGILGLTLLIMATALFANETVKAPSGWDDKYDDDIRVVTNSKTTVVIMPWQNLAGLSIEQW